MIAVISCIEEIILKNISDYMFRVGEIVLTSIA
jgi:hypothetical protein